ncbi:MAG: hypothetical protein VKP62_01370 [Candidatus Sericytochromatia bacterium]|nr:hypothetical protein [Candidatus Sericytochromatia bacterium]
MRAPRLALTALLGAAASLALTACPMQIVIFQVNLENPNLRVGERTMVRLEAQVGWFRQPFFYYRAERGRLVGLNGETAPQGGYLRAGNQVWYHAPYTASYPSAEGIRQNDTIEIIAQDGPYTTRTQRVVTITGSTVVFASTDNNGPNGTLMTAIDSGGGQMQSQPQPLLDLSKQPIKGSSPVISPNGERIAFVYYPGDGTSKVAMRDAAGQVLYLTNFNRGLALDPSWSPNGSYLLFASNHADDSAGTYDIYMMNVDQNSGGGRAITRLTSNTWDERHPAWNPLPTAPEDRIIAVSARANSMNTPGDRTQNWNIFLMNRRGTYTRSVSDMQGDGSNWAVEPAWHPNGQLLAYTRFGPVVNYQSGANKFQRIFVQDLAQSTAITPLNISNTDPMGRESSPIWSVDRLNTLYFLRTEANSPNISRIFQTQYLPGNVGGNTFPPQLVAPFQSLMLPLTLVGGTNRDISGFHPLDWR